MGYMSINKTQLDRRVKLNLELYMKVGKESIRVAKNMNCGINHIDRKSTRLNSSHVSISYAVFCLKKKRGPHERRLTARQPLACVAARPRLIPRAVRLRPALVLSFTDTATTGRYTLSLHDALPILSINKTQLDRRVKLNLELYMKVGKESIRVAKNMNCGINHIGILLRMEKTFGNYLADTYTVNIQSLKTLQSS